MPATETDRRRFVSYFTGAILGLIGALLGIPAIGYIFAPFWKKKGGGGDGSLLRGSGAAE